MSADCFDGNTANFVSEVLARIPRKLTGARMESLRKTGDLRDYMSGLGDEDTCGLVLELIRSRRFILTVDRTKKIDYGKFLSDGDAFLCPPFALPGPASYDLKDDVLLWQHPEQFLPQRCSGEKVLRKLLESGDIRRCLDLQDGLAIREMRCQVFGEVTRGTIFLFRAAIRTRDGEIIVPRLYDDEDIGLHIDTRPVVNELNPYDFIPMFK